VCLGLCFLGVERWHVGVELLFPWLLSVSSAVHSLHIQLNVMGAWDHRLLCGCAHCGAADVPRSHVSVCGQRVVSDCVCVAVLRFAECCTCASIIHMLCCARNVAHVVLILRMLPSAWPSLALTGCICSGCVLLGGYGQLVCT
jgi:hypothetical protein